MKNKNKPDYVLIICFAIILIPCIIFGYILLSTSLRSHQPNDGDRFQQNEQIENQITNNDVNKLKTNLTSLSGIDSIQVEFKQNQLKIYVDSINTLNEEDVEKLAGNVLNEVEKIFPIDKYFTKTETYNTYDLFIEVYNDLKSNDLIIYSITKNSVGKLIKEFKSKPLDQELVDKLYSKNDENDSQIDETTIGVEEQQQETSSDEQ